MINEKAVVLLEQIIKDKYKNVKLENLISIDKIEDEILLIAGFYDIDWQSRIIFNNKKIEFDFFDFLGSYSQLVLETDISAFCD